MKITNKIELELPDLTKITLTEEEAEELYQELHRVLKKHKDYTIPYAPTEPITIPMPSYPNSPTNPFDHPYPYNPSYPPYPPYTIYCGDKSN